MARILFITPYYPPEKGAAMVRISETARRLVQRGHRVTVLTTVPNYPTGIVPPEYRGRIIQEELRDGVRVVRVWNYVSRNTSFIRRILPQVSFALLAPLLGGWVVGRPDVIIVQSPPLFDALSGRILSWWKRCPFIFWVSDLWPETVIQLGIIRNRLLIRLSEWLEWSAYEHAGFIWVVAESVRKDLLRRGVPADRLFLGINGVDTSFFRPLPQAQARTELGWDDRFTVLYAGTHGVVHGLKMVLDAADRLRTHRDIHFMFIGNGSEREALIAQAQQYGLENITFLEAQPHKQMPVILAAADICLIPARKAQVLKGFLPAKMFEIMASGRPILLCVDGEARWHAEQQAGGAIYVEPENPAALASAILYLYEHPEVAEAMVKRGRAYAEATFDRDQLVAKVEARITSFLEEKAAASSPALPAPSDASGE